MLSVDSHTVTTFDIAPLNQIPGAIVDLTDRYPNIRQIIGDLQQPETWQDNVEVLSSADLIFVDGPKDGVFEDVVVPRILEVAKPGSLLILDDIRFACMQDLWKCLIEYPRIDLGSFGHFSGTGIVFR